MSSDSERWPSLVRSLLAGADQDAETGPKARTVVLSSVLLSVWAFYSALFHLTMGPRGSPVLVAVPLGGALFWVFAVPAIVRRTRRTVLAAHLLILSLLVTTGINAWLTGGFSTPTLAWSLMVPVMALILCGATMAIGYAVLCVAQLVGFYVIDCLEWLQAGDLKLVELWNFLAAMTGIFSLSIAHEDAKEEALLALRKSNRELVSARDEAARAARVKSEFLANMSHELRTPLTVVLGYVELLLEDGDLKRAPAERLCALGAIKRNGVQLMELIGSILDLSKMDAGKLAVESVEFSPVELVSEVCSLMEVRAAAKGLRLEAEYAGRIPERIVGDPLRVKQILMNLVGNAIKFTETGSVKLRLYASPEFDPRHLAFEVVDTGIGMTPEQLGRLFRPFTQGDASMTRRYGGTGLGLAICKRLADLLGARIEVSSEIGRGSSFRLLVPAEVAGPNVVGPHSNPAADAGQRPIAEVAGSEPVPELRCRVLLAEDSIDSRGLIERMLESGGVEVTCAEDGSSAVELACAAWRGGHPFDLILMDMQMPRLDGYAAARLLRSHGYSGPIVALTAHAMPAERERCIAAGCDDHLTKPIDRASLLGAIAKHRPPSEPQSSPTSG
jgi:signal transduction histidine kinase/ActR/RegA family two-component response regulator